MKPRYRMVPDRQGYRIQHRGWFLWHDLAFAMFGGNGVLSFGPVQTFDEAYALLYRLEHEGGKPAIPNDTLEHFRCRR